MAIVQIRRSDAPSADNYDAVVEKFGVNDNPPAGLIFHAYGQLADGQWQQIDVWDSREAAEQYERETQPPARDVLGGDYQYPEPTTYEVHNFIRP
jgi:hypothetical protein